ncbi:MAG: septal ring lytic transglycosylase RlpA family protein [Myxococcales bacterium]
MRGLSQSRAQRPLRLRGLQALAGRARSWLAQGQGELIVRLVLLGFVLIAAGSCCSGIRSSRATQASTTTTPPPPVDPAGGEVLRGQASFYANSLRGHPTASGERYDPRKLTAANRTLPFGTRLRVTRLDNGKSVVVTVNDRGPFGHRRRILDLSRAAAEQLDMLGAGVVQVQAQVVP